MSSRNLKFGDSLVVKEYGDDIVVNRQMVSTPFDHEVWGYDRFWVDTLNQHFVFSTPIYRKNSMDDDTKLRATCWAAIMYKTGIDEMNQNINTVPVEVVSLGKPYVVAYLRAVHEYEYSEISEQFDLSESTISQYLSDVAWLRR
jgi:hypothetical protein